MAFGYALPGGLSQYVVLGKPVLEGDDGCYLLPLAAKTGRVEAALVEPWTCVIASYQIKARTAPKTGGVLYVAGSAEGQVVLDLDGMEAGKFSAIAADGLSADNAAKLGALARRLGRKVQAGPAGLKPTDVVCAGTPSRERFLAIQEMVDADAVIGVHTAAPGVDLPVDVGRVHYRGVRLVGSTDGAVHAAYRDNPRETLKPGGKAWFVGGAGPMGTMHVIKAIMDDQGPSTVLVTDMSDERLANLAHLVSILAKKGGRKVDLTVRNAKAVTPADLGAVRRVRRRGGARAGAGHHHGRLAVARVPGRVQHLRGREGRDDRGPAPRAGRHGQGADHRLLGFAALGHARHPRADRGRAPRPPRSPSRRSATWRPPRGACRR